ncbi:hypothetical protein [Gordonia sp. NB41Y]|uniref:hypothetical protein n=1 Tax=Gordonia sp. NB41Y TaxID=875808 RepID=UPI0002BF9035|nr:hypothetical protein [Gordonia sp. NB41Y]EMP14476.1 hypothetical protein ISGA_19 [Gordonia sp. NB41Y]WLP92558.1 hypothetical protein Q9K23_10180 [Gordonia sp. NB41Y]
MIGTIGVVTVAIGGGDQLGEVELPFAGGTERFLARGREPIGVDQSVLVVAESPGRIVEVERWIVPPTVGRSVDLR